MNPGPIKQLDVSIRARLLNLAKREHRDFNVILNLYYQERLLARLASTPYRQRFLLKGGLWLSALITTQKRLLGRPTKDVDLRAEGIANDPDRLRAVFAEACEVELPDGVAFDPTGIATERITEDADYQGIRIRVPVRLAEARGRVQVDVAFGDVVTPGPREMVFPVLLEEMASPTLLGYPMESVVAEKFEAMISLSLANSRMKDFFDLHWLARNQPFAGAILQQALARTFQRRGTQFLPHPAVFQPFFGTDEGRRRQWMAFLRQSYLIDPAVPFEDVLVVLRDFLEPVHSACLEERSFCAEWSPVVLKWIPEG